MSFKMDVKRILTVRCERVKSIDYHDFEPWILFGMYNGEITVWNSEIKQQVRSLEVSTFPIRTAKFISRKNWIICGSDDMNIYVFNYNTLEKLESLTAHSDFIRCLVVHPTQPIVLSCSDDMRIKMWNWEEKWTIKRVFSGHTHFIMKIAINPRHNSTFASCSLDNTIKVWNLESSEANFTLEGHGRGINCVDYYHGKDKPYLISASDDKTIRIWDYQNKTCIQTLTGRGANITSAHFHPVLPIIVSGSEDGSVIFWSSVTYSIINTFNFGFYRCWCITHSQSTNNLCIGFDHGSVELKLGQEEPAVSMDPIGNQIIWSNQYEIKQTNINMLPGDTEIENGSVIPVNVKDLGICEIYPETIKHSSNGRFIAVCGSGEYVIYTSKALRNKTYGYAKAFAWAKDSLDYAIWESGDIITIFKDFKEHTKIRNGEAIQDIYGGHFLGVQSVDRKSVTFYDWENFQTVEFVELDKPTNVYWSETNHKVCVAFEGDYVILSLNPGFVSTKYTKDDDAVKDGPLQLVLLEEEKIISGVWVDDIFIYNNSMYQLKYIIGKLCVYITYLDSVLYILGYVKKDNRLYCMDRNYKIITYSILSCVLDYQLAIVRQDFDRAEKILNIVPDDQKNRLSYFVEGLGQAELALKLSSDNEQKFQLAIKLEDLKLATSLASNRLQWLQIANIAVDKFDFELAKKCFYEAHDDAGLLMLASSIGDQEILKTVESNKRKSKNNIKFILKFLYGNLDGCLDVLIEYDISLAALFARSYLPDRTTEVVSIWKARLENSNKKLASSIADPDNYENLFPELHKSQE